MSSFVCSRKHYSSIASNLKRLFKDSRFYLDYELRNKFSDLEVPNIAEKLIDKFVNQIELINIETFMRQYYSNSEDIEDEIKKQILLLEKLPTPKALTNLGLYNALICCNYQIELEHIKKVRILTEAELDALYFLKEMTNIVTKFICNNLPEDTTNTWSIE